MNLSCSYCGQEKWLDVSGDTVFLWCVCGCPIEELQEEDLMEKTGLGPDFLADMGFPLDHLPTIQPQSVE